MKSVGLNRIAFLLGILPGTLLGQDTGTRVGHNAGIGTGVDCDQCHLSHAQTDLYNLIVGPASDVKAWLETQAPGATDVSVSCLRCHWSSAVREEQGDEPAGGTGALYVGPDLADDHVLGNIDPLSLQQRAADQFEQLDQKPLYEPGALGPSGAIECTACHDAHDPEVPVSSNPLQHEFCGNCHGPEAFSLGDHVVVTCTACHDLHDSSLGSLLYGPTVESTCQLCHTVSGGSATPWLEDHSVGEVPLVVPPSHNPGTDCLQCHYFHQ